MRSFQSLILILSVAAMASTVHATDEPVVIPRSHQFDLDSTAGGKYRVFLAEPAQKPPAAGYAVFYVLDANAMFMTTVDAARFQHGLAPALIVGIGYPIDKTLDEARRYHDFTPVTPAEHIVASTTELPVKPEQTGGQDDFLHFIEKVVKPAIAKRYTVDPSRQVLFGHSLAGRFVLHVLFTQPSTFTHYIAASPSIWWDNASVLTEADAFTSRPPEATPRFLLLTVGEMEQKLPANTTAERSAFLKQVRMVDRARELAERLKSISSVRAVFSEFAGENHGSVVPMAIARGVRLSLTPAGAGPSTKK